MMVRRIANVYLSQTARRYDHCLKIAETTLTNLRANESTPGIDAIALYLEPFVEIYRDRLLSRQKQRNMKLPATQAAFAAAFKEFAPKMHRWKTELDYLLRDRREDHRLLFPGGRFSQYTRGKIADRVLHLKGFCDLLGIMANTAELGAIHADALALHQAVSATHTSSREHRSLAQTRQQLLEKARVNLCAALYSVEGQLMQLFATDPEHIARYIPFNLLNRKEQRRFTNSNLRPGTVKMIMRRTADGDRLLRIDNKGSVPLFFYRAARNGRNGAGVQCTVPPLTVLEMPAAELGDGTYWFVKNEHPLLAGKYELRLLD